MDWPKKINHVAKIGMLAESDDGKYYVLLIPKKDQNRWLLFAKSSCDEKSGKELFGDHDPEYVDNN